MNARPSPVMPTFESDEVFVGHQLRTRRREMKMSQTELGAVVGVSFQQVQKYERGVNRISFSTLQKFADALETPISYFLRDSGPAAGLASGQKQAAFAAPDQDTQSLLKLFGAIDDPAVRKQVVQLTKALVEAQKAVTAGKAAKAKTKTPTKAKR